MLIRKSYTFSVPEPCHEAWNSMSPVGSGRYCGQCTKVVTDFTHWTDAELLAFLKKRPDHVCGRFNKSQLEKAYTKTTLFIPWYKRAARYVIGLLLAGGVVKKAQAQEPVNILVQQDTLRKDSLNVNVVNVDAQPLVPDSMPVVDSLGVNDSLADKADPLSALTWTVPSIDFVTPTYTLNIETVTMGAIWVPEPKVDVMGWKLILDSVYNVLKPRPTSSMHGAIENTAHVSFVHRSHLPKPPYKPVPGSTTCAIIASAFGNQRRSLKRKTI